LALPEVALLLLGQLSRCQRMQHGLMPLIDSLPLIIKNLQESISNPFELKYLIIIHSKCLLGRQHQRKHELEMVG